VKVIAPTFSVKEVTTICSLKPKREENRIDCEPKHTHSSLIVFWHIELVVLLKRVGIVEELGEKLESLLGDGKKFFLLTLHNSC
jgi:hypothetical protein